MPIAMFSKKRHFFSKRFSSVFEKLHKECNLFWLAYSVVRQALSHTAVNPLLDCCHDDLQHLAFSRAELLFMPPEDGRQDISADQSRITGSQAAAGRRNGKTLFHLLQQPFTVNPMHMFVEYAVKKGMDNVSYIPGFQSVHNPKNEVQIKLII